MKKILLSIFISCTLISNAWGQLSYDSHLANVNFVGAKSHCFGLGGTFYKAFGAKFLMGLTANIYFGGQKSMDTALAYNSATPPLIQVDVKRRVIPYTADIDLRYYFVGDAESDMGVYGLAGGGMLRGVIITKSFGTYDASQYGILYEEKGDQNGFDALAVNFGVGFEKNLGNNYFFVSARYHYIVKYFDDESRYFAPKSYVSLAVGLRVPFRS